MTTNKLVITSLVFFSLLIILFFVYAIDTYVGNRYVSSKYLYISLNDSFTGKVLFAKRERTTQILTLKGQEQKVLLIEAVNKEAEKLDKEYYIADFVQPGDSVFKRSNSDTVLVIRDDKKIPFIIRRFQDPKAHVKKFFWE